MLKIDQGVIVDGIGYGVINNIIATGDAEVYYLVHFEGCSEMDDLYHEDEVRGLWDV